MTIVGDSTVFATRYALDADHGGSSLFGKLCFVLNEVDVGDYELGTSLRTMAMLLVPIVKDAGNRRDDWLYGLSAQELFDTLHGALFGEDSRYDERATDECWARFDILPQIDVFDAWQAFLVEGDDSARLVYKAPSDPGTVQESRFAPVVFDTVVRATFEALDSLVDEDVADA